MNQLLLSTPPGLEEVCAREAQDLGLEDVRQVRGGVECAASDARAIFRANACLRTASRVVVRLASGPAAEIRSLAKQVDWSAWLARDARFRVDVFGGGSRPAPMRKAIEEAVLRALPSSRVDDGEESTSIRLRIAEGEIDLGLDATGPHLHMRGYRQETGAAPLRENLAAGILLLAGYDGSQPLVDPMCGSGTFLIEAALLSRGRAPGLERRFACEGWPFLPAAVTEEERTRLRALDRGAVAAPILGSDRNAGALGVARRNSTRAGVFDSLVLERRDAMEVAPPEGSSGGIVVANPPYGKRSGEWRELPALYRAFGETLRSRFSGWTAAILVNDLGLGAALRLPDPSKIALRNGGLPCTLFLSRL